MYIDVISLGRFTLLKLWSTCCIPSLKFTTLFGIHVHSQFLLLPKCMLPHHWGGNFFFLFFWCFNSNHLSKYFIIYVSIFYGSPQVFRYLHFSGGNNTLRVWVFNSTMTECIRVNNTCSEDNTWVKPDYVNNIGVYTNPHVLCMRSGLRYDFILVTIFHAWVKGKVMSIEKDSWMLCDGRNLN